MSLLTDIMQCVQALVVCLGIVVGGVWTYFLFIRRRFAYPRANIELSSFDCLVTENARLIHAVISVTNSGDILLRSDYAELRIRQIAPLPDHLREAIGSGEYDPVLDDKAEIEWPLITTREWAHRGTVFEIEPGESDCLHADFVINSDIQVVEFYCFVSNSRKKDRGIGWTGTRLHAFDSSLEVDRMTKMIEPRKSKYEFQQKQQSQQERQQQQQQQPKQEKKPKK